MCNLELPNHIISLKENISEGANGISGQLSTPTASLWPGACSWVFITICRENGYPLIDLCHKSKCKPALVCVFHSRSDGLLARHFPAQLGRYQHLCLALISLFKADPVRSIDFSEPLHDICSSSLTSGKIKKWLADLFSFAVDIPLKPPMLWNLLVQAHVQKFHRVLKSLRLHTWKLSSYSF